MKNPAQKNFRRYRFPPLAFSPDSNTCADSTTRKSPFARAKVHEHQVPVLRLEWIVKSKEAIQRDQDKLHIILIRDFLRCQRGLRRKK